MGVDQIIIASFMRAEEEWPNVNDSISKNI
jgi:hypothetical protein